MTTLNLTLPLALFPASDLLSHQSQAKAVAVLIQSLKNEGIEFNVSMNGNNNHSNGNGEPNARERGPWEIAFCEKHGLKRMKRTSNGVDDELTREEWAEKQVTGNVSNAEPIASTKPKIGFVQSDDPTDVFSN